MAFVYKEERKIKLSQGANDEIAHLGPGCY